MQIRPLIGRMALASRQRPAVAAAVLLIVGILAHRAVPAMPIPWLLAAAVLAVGSLILRRLDACACACLSVAVALTGTAAAQLHVFRFPAHHISMYCGDEPRLAELELRIVQEPRTLSGEEFARRPLPPRQVTQAQVLRVRTVDGWRPADGTMPVHVAQVLPRLAIRQTIRAVGTLSRTAPLMNPGQFDWQTYYRRQRIVSSFSIQHSAAVEIIDDASPNLLDRARQKVRRALALGFDQQSAVDHALLRALVLGDSDPQLRDIQEDFIRTGTSHHLAISGMHIAILGGLVYLVCRLLFLSPRTSAWTGLICVVLYGLVALPSPPVVRSVVLCALFVMGILRRRSIDGVQLLALTIFLMLLYQPLDLYGAGFQLSFGTVLGLMVLAGPMYHLLARTKSRDEALMEPSTPTPGFARVLLNRLGRALLESLAAGIVAWLVSAPLIWAHFEQLNPWAIPASIVLAIPVLLSLVGGLAKIALTLLLPGFAATWAMFAAAPVALMRNIVDLLARIPGSDLPLPAAPLWIIAGFYALLAAIRIHPPQRPRLAVVLRLGPAAAAVLLVLLPVLLGLGSARYRPRDASVTLLSVGAGQCAVVELPSGKRLMIDAGSASVSDVYARIIRPFLRKSGIGRIDHLVLSHPDIDHTSGVSALLDGCAVGQVHVAPRFAADCRASATGRAVWERLSAAGRPIELLAPGRRITLDDDTTLQALWPPESFTSRQPNDQSLVVHLTCRGRSLLFCGDIVEAAQRHLAADPAAIKADVLIAPHHGSAELASASFLAAVDPKVVICSSKRYLTARQRRFDALCAGRSLYRTASHGAVRIVIPPDGSLRVEPFLARPLVPLR